MPIASIEVIPSGFKGTEATVNRMFNLVSKSITDLTIQKIADSIVSVPPICADRDYECKARKIFNFVKKYIRFERDPFNVEMLQEPIVTLKRKKGDCDDHVSLNSALLGSIGFPYAFKTIKADSRRPEEFSHIYGMVMIPNKGWIPFDTSVGMSYYGWEAPGKSEYKIWYPKI